MDNPVIDIKTGGRFLVEPIGSKKVFSREFFSEDHRAIQEMIEDFSRDRILPNVQNIEKHDKELSHELLKEMGELGLIGTDIPENRKKNIYQNSFQVNGLAHMHLLNLRPEAMRCQEKQPLICRKINHIIH